MIKFYFPRWFFPNNLGDSIVSTFIPKLLHYHYKKDVEVITYGDDMIEVFKCIPGVVNVRLPYKNEIKSVSEWINLKLDSNSFSVYPEWHPNTWKMWGENFDRFYKHPTANIITLSYLLQLGLEDYMFNNYNLSPHIPTHNKKPKLSTKLNIAIVPEDKLGGRSHPHPTCDGIGYRFNGPSGHDSWTMLISYLKKHLDCTIYEFSPHGKKFGDVCIPHIKSWIDLATYCKGFDLAILSDGGLHHVFNSQQTPVYLLGAQKFNKPYFMKLKNGVFNEYTHRQCLQNCKQNIINSYNYSSKQCNMLCERVNPLEVGRDILNLVKND